MDTVYILKDSISQGSPQIHVKLPLICAARERSGCSMACDGEFERLEGKVGICYVKRKEGACWAAGRASWALGQALGFKSCLLLYQPAPS